MLRVGVIGLGVGEQHLVGYRQNPKCQVGAVCDRDEQKLRIICDRYPEVRATTSSDDLIDDPEIDLISIASQDDDHFDQLCRSLDQGKHAFVEKPLCQSFDQLKTIRQKWAHQGGRINLKSNLVLRGAPVYRWLREKVRSDDIGQVYAFDGDYLYGRLKKITGGWRADVDGYSVMEGGGIHLVDLLLWITGERPLTVHTLGNRICTQGSAFRYDDYAAATFRFSSGMIGRITANFGCVHGHQHVVRVFGTKGTFLHDDQGARYQARRDPAPPAQSLPYATLPPSKHVLIGEFVDTVLTYGNSNEDTQTEFDVMSVCIASDKSLRTGEVEQIQYL